MNGPTAMELRQADVARKAMGKGHMLVTHLHFSLIRAVLDQVESLDAVDSHLDGLPDVRS